MRSASTLIVPVVNFTDGTEVRRDLNLGNPTGRPARLSFFESEKFFSALANWSKPVQYASFEHFAHHGATSFFARFQLLRRQYSDQPSNGVSSSPSMP